MFPNARNSLRQDEGRIPIPIAVSVYNVMSLPSKPRNNNDNDNHRGLHKDKINQESSGNAQTTSKKWFRPQHEISLLPRLKLNILVDEEIEDEKSERKSDSSMEENNQTLQSQIIYTSSSILQSVQPTWEHLEERLDLPEEWWRGKIYKSMRLQLLNVTSSRPNTAHTCVSSETNMEDTKLATDMSIFLEAPLHPTKLERLLEIPTMLPPNTVLIYFSDGSTRCTTAVFQGLLYSKVVTELSPLEDFSRFEDDVFQTLDGVAHTPTRRRTESISALLEPKNLSARLPEDDAAPLSPIEVGDPSFEISEESIAQMDDESEKVRLLALISKEEKELLNESSGLEEERKSLARFLVEASDIEAQIQKVRMETNHQQHQIKKGAFYKEVLQIKLVRELKITFPITMDSKKGYLIRNLQVPADIYTTAVSDDEISAALGYTCHLFIMLAKYLTISMRYRVFCNSSRSAIQQDGQTFLPLFSSRSVDREHLDRGMHLFSENIDCTLLVIGIDFTPKSHVLARLKRIYDHFIEGEVSLLDHTSV